MADIQTSVQTAGGLVSQPPTWHAGGRNLPLPRAFVQMSLGFTSVLTTVNCSSLRNTRSCTNRNLACACVSFVCSHPVSWPLRAGCCCQLVHVCPTSCLFLAERLPERARSDSPLDSAAAPWLLHWLVIRNLSKEHSVQDVDFLANGSPAQPAFDHPQTSFTSWFSSGVACQAKSGRGPLHASP